MFSLFLHEYFLLVNSSGTLFINHIIYLLSLIVCSVTLVLFLSGFYALFQERPENNKFALSDNHKMST